MTLSLNAILGLTTRFLVEVDGINLGGWAQCTGLAVKFNPKQIEEGGNYDYKPILADRLEYTPITLTRAMNAKDSAQVQHWLSSKVSSWMHASSSGGGATAQITLCDPEGHPIATWRLRNVFPSRWDGPVLEAKETAGIAMEKLEIIHEGFL
jgi:phage tail-like protein